MELTAQDISTLKNIAAMFNKPTGKSKKEKKQAARNVFRKKIIQNKLNKMNNHENVR